MLTPEELQRLKAACAGLPATGLLEEEAHVFDSPILILMSTVLSLNRSWYKVAKPARERFEKTTYAALEPKTLVRCQELLERTSARGTDWLSLARSLWGTNEQQKARLLSRLVDYFVSWRWARHPGMGDLDALRAWAKSTSKEQFLGSIPGLGPRAYEQLLWYLDDAIKLDRHVSRFVDRAVGRTVSEATQAQALRAVAAEMGLSATQLDARIWDRVQGQG